MSDDEFLAKCKSIDPSSEVDRDKNLETIKARLLNEEEQFEMKTKKVRKPAFAAALLAGIMLFSAAVYATVPVVWRYFDTRVIEGEEFITDFAVGEFDLPDGTTSRFGGVGIDREALEAAGGGVIIVEVDGEEWVVLDELHFDSLEDGMALLQLDNVLIPAYFPQGFNFSRFTFPVNPNNHRYMGGGVLAAEFARIYFSSEDGDIISIHIGTMHELLALAVAYDQQGLVINGKAAVLSNSLLSSEQLAALEGVELFDGEVFDDSPWSVTATRNDGKPHLAVVYNGIAYGVTTESDRITSYDLVRMIASMR